MTIVHRTLPSPDTPRIPSPDAATAEVPSWVFDLLGNTGPRDWRPGPSTWQSRRIDGGDHRLISVRVPAAVDLGAEAFERASRAVYLHLAAALDGRTACHPVRLWNFIPRILDPLGDLSHRYMVFNAGRYAALSSWLGGADGIDRRVATASGVGHAGDALVVHCLAAARAGEPVENPRQVPSYLYSRRFGPRPPCFARATRIGRPSRDWLLVGGTASVRGEASVFDRDLGLQLRETLCNLAAVVRAGVEGDDGPRRSGAGAEGPWLHRYRHLRIYHPRSADRDAIAAGLRQQVNGARTEFVRADLCRPELLVEIEGLAELGG